MGHLVAVSARGQRLQTTGFGDGSYVVAIWFALPKLNQNYYSNLFVFYDLDGAGDPD